MSATIESVEWSHILSHSPQASFQNFPKLAQNAQYHAEYSPVMKWITLEHILLLFLFLLVLRKPDAVVYRENGQSYLQLMDNSVDLSLASYQNTSLIK